MNVKLLSTESQEFISKNAEKDPAAIALSNVSIEGVTAKELANQINSLRKAKVKCPEWSRHAQIYWPPALSVEQSSSELASNIRFEGFEGDLAMDLTGGAGIDTWTLSKRYKNVIYIEKQQELCEIAQYNFKILGANNIEIVNASAEDFLIQCPKADLIYIDPSRRTSKGKVFHLSDCEPEIITLHEIIAGKTNRWIVKNSPLLDIQSLLNDLKNSSKIRVVAINNEVKELVAEISNSFEITRFEAINASYSLPTQILDFEKQEIDNLQVSYSDPQSYIYEPNAAIMKLQATDICSANYKCNKIAPNSHLLTSEKWITDFPGRAFRMMGYLSSNFKSIRERIPDERASVFTRNYPLKPDLLRKKLKLREGEKDFVVGTTLQNGKKVLLHLVKM